MPVLEGHGTPLNARCWKLAGGACDALDHPLGTAVADPSPRRELALAPRLSGRTPKGGPGGRWVPRRRGAQVDERP